MSAVIDIPQRAANAALIHCGMETDPGIVAIARAALAEFGPDAAEIMEKRASDHALAGEDEGWEVWGRVAAAVRELPRTSAS